MKKKNPALFPGSLANDTNICIMVHTSVIKLGQGLCSKFILPNNF